MSNVLYDSFKESLLNKEHDLSADAITASLIDTDDETFAATDNTYVQGANGILDASKVAAQALGTLDITSGVFDSADFTWSTVSGDESEAIVLWNDSTTSPIADALIAWYDTSITGMPVTPNGGNINVTVNGSGWFSL